AISRAGLEVARERLNPEASVEIEKETPKQSFGLALPLELGGKRAKRIAVGQATIRAGDAQLAVIIAQVRNDVRRAYYEVLVADARLRVMRELRDLSQRAHDTAQARFDAGDAPRLEVLQADLAFATSENEATAADGVALSARSKLNAVLALPLDTVRPLSTSLDAGGAVVASAALDLERRGSAELATLDRRIDEQRARLELAHALRTPDLVPTATLTLFTSHKAGVMVEQTTLAQLTTQRQAAHMRIDGEVTAAAALAEAQR